MKHRYMLAALAIAAPSAWSQPVATLEEAISNSVIQNPEVTASWYTFEAAREEQRVGEGGYYPRVDLIGQVGHERLDLTPGGKNSYDPWSARLTLTQMLFDGFSTRSEVARLDHVKKVRFYEFRGTSEEIALESTRAYLDTLRYQQLVELAKENYVQHRTVYEDIEDRTEAGIGRRVDLEQASARLALAEANLLTEATNLHDVSARFQRIIGELPAETLAEPVVPAALIPDTRAEALNTAYMLNPGLNAAVENVMASQAALKVKDAAMMPRLDLRLRKELEDYTDGIDVERDTQAIELVMTYNLYNGGSDRARQREFHKRIDVAHQLREKACRDVRQQVVIAYNDISSLQQQEQYLKRNQEAIAKAREAYRKQFDIGQRTLLDLLDTENEYFEVRRTYVNTLHDLKLAQARTLAAMGQLLASFDVAGKEGADAMKGMAGADSGEGRCPPELPVQKTFDKDALVAGLLTDSRFRELDDGKLAFRMNAQFAFNSSILVNKYDKDIDDAAQYLKDNPDMKAVIAGHTDSTGTDEYNQWLSERRAKSVYTRLVETHGIDPARLESVGYGESQPMADNGTAEGRQMNRRVDMVIDKPK
jgi:adhesin transport system outer membrane protein